MASDKKLHLKKDRFLRYFFIFLGLLIVSLLVCLFVLRHVATLQEQSDNERLESYLLADELRQSSDDLTKMIRLYVMTGDEHYKQYFFEILAIRRGESVLPEKYHQIYWDLIVPGTPRPRAGTQKQALKQRLIDHGFTLEEFALLEKAEHASDKLALLEMDAINAMEGKIEDSNGITTPNPELARKIVFGKKYFEMKRQVMIPLQEFYDKVEIRTKQKAHLLHQEMLLTISVAIILSALSTIVMLISIYKALTTLSKVTSDNETLLLNVLPSPIADRLKLGEEPIADEIPQASVLFADIVNFTQITTQLGATKMVQMLNTLFDEFDTLSEKYEVEKVKTIGDNYMAASGIPIEIPDHAQHLADFALAILEKIQEFNKNHQTDFNVRIGMTYGAVIAGVIGHKKFIYDVWGEVVNIASRMESTGESGKIQITEKMAMMLSDLFIVEKNKEIDVKGIGKMETFFLIGRKTKKVQTQGQDVT
ncbi:MAG: adenylate/guanylate cyclase domain-containing protein [Simkaniaceae bacterium]|nr:adenylate/guanylate cyclase domain-containing protein [Simkaniaceae bacterium]